MGPGGQAGLGGEDPLEAVEGDAPWGLSAVGGAPRMRSASWHDLPPLGWRLPPVA